LTMGPGALSGKSFSRKGSVLIRLSRDKRAQIHVLETVMGGIFLMAAIYASYQISSNVTQSDTGISKLEILGGDALRSLDNLPPEGVDGSLYGNSTLRYYCVTGQIDNLTEFFNMSIPTSLSYSFSLELYQSAGVEGEVVLSYSTSSIITTNNAICHRMVCHQGEVYDFQLVMWQEPRGVAA
jgi:hypothetical protein